MILLSDEQLAKELGWNSVDGIDDYERTICATQLRRVVEWLDSPCTEHSFKLGYTPETKVYWNTINGLHKLFHSHKRDCLECLAELRSETR